MIVDVHWCPSLRIRLFWSVKKWCALSHQAIYPTDGITVTSWPSIYPIYPIYPICWCWDIPTCAQTKSPSFGLANNYAIHGACMYKLKLIFLRHVWNKWSTQVNKIDSLRISWNCKSATRLSNHMDWIMGFHQSPWPHLTMLASTSTLSHP